MCQPMKKIIINIISVSYYNFEIENMFSQFTKLEYFQKGSSQYFKIFRLNPAKGMFRSEVKHKLQEEYFSISKNLYAAPTQTLGSKDLFKMASKYPA